VGAQELTLGAGGNCGLGSYSVYRIALRVARIGTDLEVVSGLENQRLLD